MNPLQFLIPLGWVETVGPVLPMAIFVLVLVNMVTRLLGHRAHRQQLDDGGDDEALNRYTPHVFTTLGLVFLTFLSIVYRPVSGMILAVPVIGLLVTDFFEFESRLVEARNELPLERPKAGLAISVLVLVYAVYYAFRFLYGPYLDLIFA